MRKLLFASAVLLSLSTLIASAQSLNRTADSNLDSQSNRRNDSAASQLDRDKDFMKKLFKSDEVAVAIGEMAQQNSQSDVIKQFSQGMVDERKKFDTTLDPVARQAGVPRPEKTKEKKDVAKLKSLSGPAFDKEFLNLILKQTHEDLKDANVEANKSANIGLREIALANSTAATKRMEQMKGISQGK